MLKYLSTLKSHNSKLIAENVQLVRTVSEQKTRLKKKTIENCDVYKTGRNKFETISEDIFVDIFDFGAEIDGCVGENLIYVKKPVLKTLKGIGNLSQNGEREILNPPESKKSTRENRSKVSPRNKDKNNDLYTIQEDDNENYIEVSSFTKPHISDQHCDTKDGCLIPRNSVEVVKEKNINPQKSKKTYKKAKNKTPEEIFDVIDISKEAGNKIMGHSEDLGDNPCKINDNTPKVSNPRASSENPDSSDSDSDCENSEKKYCFDSDFSDQGSFEKVRKNKRRASSDDSDNEITFPLTPGGGLSYVSSPPAYRSGALPPSSPPPFSPFTPLYSRMDSDDDIDDLVEEAQEVAIDDANDEEEEGERLAMEDDEADGEDLFGSDMENDYKEIGGLDDYENVDIDDNSNFATLDPAERAKIEARLRRRDLEEGRVLNKSRIPAAFLQAMDDENWDNDDSNLLKKRSRRLLGEKNIHAALLDGTFDVDDEEKALTLEDLKDIKGDSVGTWINEAGPRQAIAREFRHFLLSFVNENGISVYGERIRKLGEVNGESLDIDYPDLALSKPLLGYFLANAPREMLSIMDDLAMDAVLTVFPDYARICPEIHVRIMGLPAVSSLRDLRQSQLNTLIRVSGVVSRRTSVFPQLKYVKFNCGKCGAILGPFYQDNRTEVKIGSCTNCQSKGPFTVNSENTVYRNYQKITLQETPGTVPAGRLPRNREVILLWDLIDVAKPGDEIEVTGIYCHSYDASLNARQGFPVFSTVIEANSILKRSDEFAAFKLTEEDRREIRALSKSKDLERRIIKSIAPSIYGHSDIKVALALCLFGGVPKDIGGKLRTRGDINVLLLGDPGTAKSQFLKYIENTAHRAVFTTGQGASAVGLTASVRKDPVTREWTLEGGALVLADRGVCLIDEFDKMNDTDRTSIHEAMEQQSISISKAGIVASLQARCSVIAAANPIGGRYKPSLPFSQNVLLTEPILSRFDVLCVVRDEVDSIKDELLGKFVVQSHMNSHPLSKTNELQDQGATGKEDQAPKSIDMDEMELSDVELIPQDLLKKYIMYARENVSPKIQKVDYDKVTYLYSELRRESLATGSIPITVRHIEAIVRLCESRARMHLRDFVRSDDLDVAIKVTLSSFISAQKFSVARSLKRSFSKYLTVNSDFNELLYLMLCKLVQEKLTFYQFRNHGNFPNLIETSFEELELQARNSQIYNLKNFYSSKLLVNQGFIVDFDKKVIVKRFDM
ncbi:DNA replication licensing factor mcm2 [Smittium mucronatum]|uniref:DNA replication licensing factor MCM2 n=1 Tax=Smittium mucronatum TaxID=133383 RepID=A0A1R0H7K5_9FUNG|nr:DNA replication licensing factor mcm2 [Smittium mucronatum]